MRVRIHSSEFEHFRNVAHGTISFPCSQKKNPFSMQADVVGIYGQNGSGKTTFIYVLEILKHLLSGETIAEHLNECIAKTSDEARLSFTFGIDDGKDNRFRAVYSAQFVAGCINESLKASHFENGKWTRMTVILASNSEDSTMVLTPAAKRKEAFGFTTQIMNELQVNKILCAKEHRSFLFSKELLGMMEENADDWLWLPLFQSLRHFGLDNFFVISNRVTGLITIDAALPFSFRTRDAAGQFALPLDCPAVLPLDVYKMVSQVIQTINVVLKEIVPGMEISIYDLGKEVMENGETGARIQLIHLVKMPGSDEAIRLPLKHESEGIKKIISILHLFISAYNNSGITLAIDELDSGIYEYLLGELLRIMQDSGLGQIIFTSHNLRPLEVLDSASIIFTTINPDNRYVKGPKIKSSNNPRRCYFRDITLGCDGESLYQETNSIEIAHAMRKVGRITGGQKEDR